MTDVPIVKTVVTCEGELGPPVSVFNDAGVKIVTTVTVGSFVVIVAVAVCV